MAYCLPLVNPDIMNEAMNLISAEVNTFENEDYREWLNGLQTYLRDTWFQRYSVLDWNHYSSQAFEHITNNAAGTWCVWLRTGFFVIYVDFD